MRQALAALARFVGSYGLCIATLALLFVLTWFGTLEQRYASIYDVQKKYFESMVITGVRITGPEAMPVLLPGGYVLLSVLAVNLIVGGIVRVRKSGMAMLLAAATVVQLLAMLPSVSALAMLVIAGLTALLLLVVTTWVWPQKDWGRLGVLIVHGGILVFLAAGLVEFHFSQKGTMVLSEQAFAGERQASDEFQAYFEWDLVVVEHLDGVDGRVREHVVPYERFERLKPSEAARFEDPALPFDVRVSGFQRNALVEASADGSGVDGLTLRGLPVDTDKSERNEPGMLVTLIERGRSQQALLHGEQAYPWRVQVAGADGALETFDVDLRRRRWHVPFTLRLDDVLAAWHPGTNQPKEYSSHVTKLEEGGTEAIHITMNLPLRHKGYTFFQSGYQPGQFVRLPGGGMARTPEMTVLAVVKNPADSWPLSACGVVLTGLTFLMSRKLWLHLAAEARKRRAREVALAAGVGLGARALGFLLATLLALGCAAPAHAEPEDAPPPQTASQHPTRPRWSDEAIAAADAIPVQAGGRVKPLLTYAGYTLLALNGRKSVKVVEDGEERSLGPTEWFLDVIFFPQVAATYRMFLVTDDAALDAIGFDAAAREKAAHAAYEGEGAGQATRRKRDRWSYAELAPARMALGEQADRIARIPENERTRIEQQIWALANNLSQLGRFFVLFQHATGRLEVPEDPALRALFSGRETVALSEALASADDLLALLRTPPGEKPGDDTRRVLDFLLQVHLLAGGQDSVDPKDLFRDDARPGDRATWPSLLPRPAAEPEPTWDVPFTLVARGFRGQEVVPDASVRLLAAFERVGDALARPGDSEVALRRLSDDLVAAAKERGDYDSVPLEVTYQRLDPVHWAKVLSMVGLMFALLGLLSLAGRFGLVMRVLAWLTLGAAGAMLIGGIVMRCVIRERPPVSTLYETALFTTATGMLVCFVIEGLFRRRIGLPLAGVVGTLGLLLAGWLEDLNKTDTMPTLQAVLDTNFWLATHVTTVTFGYTAGLLAALLGQVHVLGVTLGIGRGRPDVYAGLHRTVYGVICFGILLSLVGTVLGGIWANDSWGRFWGWDPKENGALMIVLWELIMLHARMGGYVGPLGFSMLAVVGGAVVSFSWWHVNQLGVGLHAYGFTAGIQNMLDGIYLWTGAVLLAGVLGWFLRRRAVAAS